MPPSTMTSHLSKTSGQFSLIETKVSAADGALQVVVSVRKIFYHIDEPFQLPAAMIAQPDTLNAVCHAQSSVFVSLDALDSDRKVGYMVMYISLQ